MKLHLKRFNVYTQIISIALMQAENNICPDILNECARQFIKFRDTLGNKNDVRDKSKIDDKL